MRTSWMHVLAGVCLLAVSQASMAAFAKGNVLAAVGAGKIKEFTPTGTLVATYDSGTNSNETTGMCMDAAGNLYATMFTAGKIAKWDPNGNLISGSFISPGTPESCQVDQAGNLYIGLTSGGIKKYNPTTGALIATFSDNPSRSGWIDIAADQCTIFYADDSPAVSRYNVCTSTQLPDFATVGTVSGLRILPGSGDVLASNRTGVARLSPTGTLLGQYNVPPGNSLIFAVTLDPDGQTFWTADLQNGNIFRFNLNPINSTPITTFNDTQFVDTGGILVIGEITVGGPGPGGGPPPVSNLPVPTLSEWALAALALLLAVAAFTTLRRRNR
jgi:streptogramin lyase